MLPSSFPFLIINHPVPDDCCCVSCFVWRSHPACHDRVQLAGSAAGQWTAALHEDVLFAFSGFICAAPDAASPIYCKTSRRRLSSISGEKILIIQSMPPFS